MAWWQKKLLRYALSRTGLFDDNALDPDNLGITLGKKNVVELKDVGLNIKRIAKLAQLPPSLRVETARVLSLRLTVPADIYQSGIVADVDGVELSLRLDEGEQQDAVQKETKRRTRSPVTARSPQHRKVHQRLHSPPPYDPGGLEGSEEVYIPTTEQLAKSFLLEEPVQERKELEASVAANTKGLEESITSESSDGGDIGMGGTMGLPGFLAGFLQGIVDRLQVHVKNVEAKLETEVAAEGQQPVPVTIQLHVAEAHLASVTPNRDDETSKQVPQEPRRRINLQELSLNLVSDSGIFSELFEMPSHDSPTQSRRQNPASPNLKSSSSSSAPIATASTQQSFDSAGSGPSPKSRDAMRESTATDDEDRFADAGEENEALTASQASHSDLDIQPGDDNISWGSRRSKSSAPTEDLWKSMVSEDDLPESLVLHRASTPRAQSHSSRSASPDEARKRRDISPRARSLQSPGSWPRLDESPVRNRYQQSPGSWPTLDQSQQSVFQPLTASPAAPVDEPPTDNKRAALQASFVDAPSEHPDVPRTPSDEAVDALATSRVFTHEEAESMYMSAMSHSVQMHVPGGWDESSETEDMGPPMDTRQVSSTQMDEDTRQEQTDEDLAYGQRPYSTPIAPLSGNVTPRAQTPSPDKQTRTGSDNNPKASKQLLYVDSILLLLPVGQEQSESPGPARSPPLFASRSFTPHEMPGTFSAYSEMSASRLKSNAPPRDGSGSVSWARQETAPSADSKLPVSVEIGAIKCQLDIPCGRLLYRLATKAMPVLKGFKTEEKKKPPSDPKQTNDTAVTVSVQNVGIALRESTDLFLPSGSTDDMSIDSAVTILCQDIDYSSSSGQTDVRIGSFRTLLGTSCLLTFNRSRDVKTSMIISEQTPDIGFVIANKSSVIKRPITELNFECLPMDILLDLPVIDGSFGSFGGLSGVLEVGNSILSESGIANSSSSSVKPAKGVRFEGDAKYIGTEPEIKVNGRIGGVNAILQGSTCNVQLRTTALKTIYREQGTVATVEQVLFSGPYLIDSDAAPISADLSTLRLEYFTSPQDKDLERLLSLLTPSKDKYDTDDDILIDTLLRQRKKGAVARASVANVKVKCDEWTSMATLSTLGDELSKLSAVAKYLPEDERPGLLTLVRVKDCEARVPVNDRFGNLHVSVSDVHCAHVGLPALLALSVGDIRASQNGKLELLHPLMPFSGTDNLPSIMARMLGDEVEPIVKVKLFNVCVEYSVPALLDLTNMDKEPNTEEIVAELAKSVANMAIPESQSPSRLDRASSDLSGTSAKKTKLDLLVHDSAIGLTPQKLSSKALLVLTDAWFSSTVPPEDRLTTSLELRKAGLFVADNVLPEEADSTLRPRGSPGNTTVKPKLTTALAKHGFVSVGSIMAAKVAVRVEDSADNRTKSVDVDFRNELLLLETCADSTQTLIATLSGLSPPIPPSKQPKYLTEPMTIEDMMASFTGDAYAKDESAPEKLFDVEDEPGDDADSMLDAQMFSEYNDQLLEESEMTSSLYGPVSGVLTGVDKPDDDGASEGYLDTAASLLEDDPFEMPLSPADAGLGDSALVRELNKQCKPAVSDEPVDLGLYEIEDLGFDALGGNQRTLGTQYRFNTPGGRKRKTVPAESQPDLPLKLKLRDLHIIWNIYDGYDWQRTREGITEAVEQVEIRAEQRKAKQRQSMNEREEDESVIGDFLFNSIYIGVPKSHDAQELRRQINQGIDDMASETESAPISGMSRPTTTYSASGRQPRQRQQRRLKLDRSKAHKVAFELKGVSADILVFPPESADVVSSVDLRVRDFEIFDNVPTSTWRKFLTQQENDPRTREMSKPMMHVELFNVRTLENFAASEITIHVSVLPLRLHVDQDALDFITRFFEFKDSNAVANDSTGDQPFLQRVEVDTVDMCLDYKPKQVDYAGLRSGHTNEFMNFVILDAANIKLKHAIVYGIKGFEPLHKTLNDVWMPDIKRNQLPTIVAGLAPMRSLVNIGTGVRDVVAIPVREYKKDGRIVRSVQKGAFHFGKTTASELARLGAKVAIGTQNLLQGAEGFLAPDSASPSGRPRRNSDQWQDVDDDDDDGGGRQEQRAISAYANQPLGVFSGLRSARRHLEHDLLTARDALIAVQGDVLESSGPGSAAAAVAKHAPTLILRPIIGASRAVGTSLLGVGNQIDRGNVRRVEDKYKRR